MMKHIETTGFARKAFLLIGIWGVGAVFMALFWVRSGDLVAARREASRETLPPSEDTDRLMPEITRRDFVFKLPVPGEKGKYLWKVKGRKSVSVSPTTDRIFGFNGEMVDGDERTVLTSPVVLFNKEDRILSSQEGVVLQSEWARIDAPEIVMDMKSNLTEFSGGVTSEINMEEAAKRGVVPASPPRDDDTPPPAATDKPKTNKKKRSPLIITSKKLKVDMKHNRAIYTGKVVARDEGGVIFADRMEAENYTKEETKKDPKLKGVKTVTCIGNVVIDQTEAKKQARCVKAFYDAKSNIIHLHGDPKTGKKVVYRDENTQRQVKAFELIFDRNANTVTFERDVETIEFNPDRNTFLGFMEPDRQKEKESTPERPSQQ